MRQPTPFEGRWPRNGIDPAARWPAVHHLLHARGAGDMHHPGGTLLQHLHRVTHRLAHWGAHPDLQVAGLCHAMYGTDGFDHALISTHERPLLTELIGERAESLVYLYASCDRNVVYPRLESNRPVTFRDRFTGRDHVPPEPDLRAFLEITAANELDVLTHNTDFAARYGSRLHHMLTHTRDLLSAPAWTACQQELPGNRRT